MATVVQLKRSETSGVIPSAGDIAVAELAVNLADGALYTKRTDGSIIEIGVSEEVPVFFANEVDLGDLSGAGETYDMGGLDGGSPVSEGILLTNLSVTDSGGDGSLSYDNTTGVFTYTGPSASDVRAHFGAGTGITITDGTISTTITQYTDTDARAAFSAGTGISITDGEISTSITQYADSDARTAISVTDSGGDGSLSYDNSTGVITYTGPSASDIRAHFSAGNGITITSGEVAVNTDTIATRQYVNTIASASIHYHDPVRVETPSALNATYDNGTSGVGATLTNAGTQAALQIDGVTLSVNDRVLVYKQANAAHNGVYVVSNVGSGSTNWVLTRASDADNYGASDPTGLGAGDAFFVKEGTTGAGELYVMNTTGTITLGTTEINFTQISSAQIYSAGTGLTLTGTQFSINASQTQITSVGTLTNLNVSGTTSLPSDTSIGNVTSTELGYLDGVTSGIQTQLNAKAPTADPTFTGTVTLPSTTAIGNVSSTELGYLDGVSSAIQTQLNTKASTGKAIAMAIVFGG